MPLRVYVYVLRPIIIFTSIKYIGFTHVIFREKKIKYLTYHEKNISQQKMSLSCCKKNRFPLSCIYCLHILYRVCFEKKMKHKHLAEDINLIWQFFSKIGHFNSLWKLYISKWKWQLENKAYALLPCYLNNFVSRFQDWVGLAFPLYLPPFFGLLSFFTLLWLIPSKLRLSQHE